jgi:hypothetical protein
LRLAEGDRSDATVVIITQLPAAQAINATWDSPIAMFGQCSTVSISSVSGCQFSAADGAAEREDHRGAHQRLLVDEGPADAQTGSQSEQTGDHPDDQPNASPSRT